MCACNTDNNTNSGSSDNGSQGFLCRMLRAVFGHSQPENCMSQQRDWQETLQYLLLTLAVVAALGLPTGNLVSA